jgi:hypothetical protein
VSQCFRATQEGIEGATNKDIAGEMIKAIENISKKRI